MATFYTKERARYGGVSGTIIPFPIKLPTVNVPNEEIGKSIFLLVI